MTQIVVSPERLEAVASTFDSQKSETETILSALQSTMEGLDADWDGVAQSKFYAQWNEMLPRMTQFTQLLGEIAGELRRIAQVFRETDQQVI
ncbi:MAG: WXG100 family type VII secretion target [Anaerolineae bacterium]|jgi:WXG100 family type VII secretion target